MQVDEALGLALVEGVAFVIGGQAEVVQAGLGATTGDDGAPAVQRHPDVTGDVFLGGGHERVERALQRAVPETVVGELAPLLLDATLVAAELTLHRDVLELLVSGDEGEGARGLIDLAALDAHETVLDQVEAADTGIAGPLVELLDGLQHADLLSVDGNGHTGLEGDDDLVGLMRASGILGIGVEILDGSVPDVLE